MTGINMISHLADRMPRYWVVVVICAICLLASGVLAQAPTYLGRIPLDSGSAGAGVLIMPLGDQNGDGFDDFLVHYSGVTLAVFFGGQSIDSTPALIFDSLDYLVERVGDLNGDMKADVAAGSLKTHRVHVYLSNPLDSLRDWSFGEDAAWCLGNVVSGNDINANGTNELIGWSKDQASLLLYELGESPDSVVDLRITPANLQHNGYGFGRSVIAGDYNGDGYQDLGGSYNPTASSGAVGTLYLYWGGPGFDTIPDMLIRPPDPTVDGVYEFSRVSEHLGDISGDGWDDFLVTSARSGDDTLHFIYFGGPLVDTIPDIILTKRMYVADRAGDVNGDGHDDIITGFPFPSNHAGFVLIYYGGPDMDNVPDVTIDDDDFPCCQDYFGQAVSGIGDYNGDGVDDFAFTSQGFPKRPWLYIYLGWRDPTDVDDIETDPGLPSGYELRQNYPNPFNASTVIEFTLPQRGQVELAVYNLLGQRVATLLNRELGAGTHRVSWTAEDVSSGVYVARLTSESGVLSKKMVLMK